MVSEECSLRKSVSSELPVDRRDGSSLMEGETNSADDQQVGSLATPN